MITRFTLSQRAYAAAARFACDTRGVTVVEFAIVAPVMGLLLLGAMDIGHSLYMRTVMQGVVQKTARDSTLQDSGTPEAQAVLDGRVRKQVKAIANNAEIEIKRRFYRTFSEASEKRAEDWTDTDENGTCNAGEPFEDMNHNNRWDADGGNDGQGGAKDTVVYTVTATYPRFFPIYNFIGGSKVTKISASTVLKNQPYGDQASYAPPVIRNCP
jgi:Flp pilus assembly protein TadG